MAAENAITEKKIDLHDDRLYARRAIAPGIAGGFDAINAAHIQQYQTFGFLSIKDAFSPLEVQDALDGLLHLISGGNPAFTGVQFEAQATGILDSLSIDQKQDAVRKLMWFTKFEPHLLALSQHPKLLALVKRLIDVDAPAGSDETPIMFQDMALLKPPKLGREKPWHQDKAYFEVDVRERVVGVWIALDAATTENGCMHLLPQLPREPMIHHQRRDWQICDSDILGNECVATPLKPGGVLIFDGLLVHGTPHNNSDKRRRALQFHYRSNRFPATNQAARLAVFGSEGKDVQC